MIFMKTNKLKGLLSGPICIFSSACLRVHMLLALRGHIPLTLGVHMPLTLGVHTPLALGVHTPLALTVHIPGAFRVCTLLAGVLDDTTQTVV